MEKTVVDNTWLPSSLRPAQENNGVTGADGSKPEDSADRVATERAVFVTETTPSTF
jgi:hypothetical protein